MPLRGMKDRLPQECFQHKTIVNICLNIARRFHYKEISTPVLEDIKVFSKTLGADILDKEMYQFTDKGENKIALRPEGTAGIVRCFIEEKLYRENPKLRVAYQGPMFRHERPQKGRLRQFHQLGVEFFGEKTALAEVEVISMAYMILKELKILPKTQFIINSIGDSSDRSIYREKLIQYLSPYKKDLSSDSQMRLEKNPLRILDSKSEQDQKLLEKAPKPKDFLNKNSMEFYQTVLRLLEERGLDYKPCDFLVRGLDYYSHTVFEFISSDLGAQSAVLAGGRYDSLTEMMGGPPCPAVGWACGIERLALLSPIQKDGVQTVALVEGFSSKVVQKFIAQVAQNLRENGCSIYLPETGSLGKQLKKAHKQECAYALIFGENEWNKKQALLKNMQTGQQETLSLDNITTDLKNKIDTVV